MNVLLIDDHPLYREGMKALLFGLDPDIQVNCCSGVLEATSVQVHVDLVLLDMHLPGTSHLEALARVRELFEGASIVVVSADEDPRLVLGAIDAGASGYIPKSTDPELTIQALRIVLAQGVYLPQAALRQVAQVRSAPVPTLSDKQTAVLQRLLQGKANKVIARELDIAEGTVKAHLWAVYQALGVSSRSQAMCKAFDLGLLRRT
jgi:DNA-binding NarL/FixJ family response regulator